METLVEPAAPTRDLAPTPTEPGGPVPTEPGGPAGPPTRASRWRGLVGWPRWPALATLVAVGGVIGIVVWQLHPSLLLSNTTTAGGDTGAHVALPAYLRDHLLPHGRITGWSPEWYGGYPALTFYFPLPSMLVVAANLVMPYDIAFKLVTVLGLVTLPVAAWAMGRLWGARRPVPACLAVATLPFLFDQSFTIDGGNIASTLAGEFAFSISLSLALVFLGLVARGLRTGRHRALAAGLLALTALCHMVPTIFAAAGAVVLTLGRLDRHRLRWVITVGLTGAAITGFWAVPFVLRQAYTTDMGYERVTNYIHSLAPHELIWALVLAGIGTLISVIRLRPLGAFLAIMAGLSAAGFVLAPGGKLYNARFLPFWILCVYLLAGVAVAEMAIALGEMRARVGRHTARPTGRRFGTATEAIQRPGAVPGRPRQTVAILTPLIALAAAATVVILPLVSWAPRSITASFVPDWVHWNYSGYEGKAAYPEYHSLINTMASVGANHGCGRAMWEYGPELNQLGTPMALMLLPYWTKGCIDSMEGLLFESSASTPAHFINQSELSETPSRAVRGLDYSNLDVAAGVRHLQLLGVRYYMAFTPQAQAQAAVDPDLARVAQSGPWAVNDGGQVVDRTWDIYQVRDSAEVAPLSEQPVVMTGVAQGGKSWLNASMDWYLHPNRWDVPAAASGPSQWSRVAVNDASPPRRPVVPAVVSHITSSDDRISFNVDRVGSPVLVKTSYFPNWQAAGAQGPWRVAPNLMVVVPTSRHVTLHYGTTPVDVLGWVATIAGIASLVWLARAGQLKLDPKAATSDPAEPGALVPEAPSPLEPTRPASGPPVPGEGRLE